MDILKKTRAHVRTHFTKTMNELKSEMDKAEVDDKIIEAKAMKMESKLEKLHKLDEDILALMLNGEFGEDELNAEQELADSYEMDWTVLHLKIKEKLLSPSIRPPSPDPSVYGSASSMSAQKKYKLPKIEIKKFGGELHDWIGWWSQFEKIDQDEEIHDSDKFQYLFQATIPDSKARRLVEKYPQSSGNYTKVIAALKDRFGDSSLLTEMYVRQFIRLVIAAHGQAQEKMDLSNVYDEIEANLMSLGILGIEASQNAVFLLPLVESSLPEEVVKVWQRSPMSGYDEDEEKSVADRLQSLLKFLRKEVKGAERLSMVKTGFQDSSKQANNNSKASTARNKKSQDIPTAAGLLNSDGSGSGAGGCCFCGKRHSSQDCIKGQSMTLDEKRNSVKGSKCCFICLKPGHRADKCKTPVKCHFCSKKHYVVMCPDSKPTPKEVQLNQKKVEDIPEFVPAHSAMSRQSTGGGVLLGTTLVRLTGNGEDLVVRLVYDSGNTQSSIKKETASRVGATKVGEEWRKSVLYGGLVTKPRQYEKYNVCIQSMDRRKKMNLILVDEPQICLPLPRVPNGPWIQEFAQKDVFFNDYQSQSEEIEILIGSNHFGKLLTGRFHHSKCGLYAIETLFGWTLMGEIPAGYDDQCQANARLMVSMSLSSINVKDLWDLETIGIRDTAESKSKEDEDRSAKEHFSKTVTRKEDGRYCVTLPWSDGVQQIPHNFSVAEKRLMSTTTKLHKLEKYEDYNQIFKAWEKEGIIEEVSDANSITPCHYLPHRAVLKPESQTTPVRPVFDASCKTGRNPSLNDCLVRGPNLMELIPDILMRFREKRIGVISDIRKAFQMVEVEKSDRDFFRFLWWKNAEDKKVKIYRHCRVVFGVNCSPFQLAAVVEKHLSEVGDSNKVIADKLLQSLYVDNCVTSVNTFDEYEKFRHVSTELLSAAMMELRQWEFGPAATPSPPKTTVLGLIWDKSEDTLSCDIPSDEPTEKITKRVLLSQIQKIFDPMGFLSPSLIHPKLLMQQAWATKIGWDEELPQDIRENYKKWVKTLRMLEEVRIPRWMTSEGPKVRREYHLFCDASQSAYAAVLFMRTIIGSEVNLRILQSKARVAPIKKMTIPRLELLACTIGARLIASVKKSLDLDLPTFLWSDSTTAIAWIKRNNNWGTFVGNRVKEILTLTNSEDWRHVPGEHNPADLPSRGCYPHEYVRSKWWEGPDWLKLSSDQWPTEDIDVDEELVVQEQKKTASIHLLAKGEKSTERPWFVPFSTYKKNIRFLAWMTRFKEFLMDKCSVTRGPLTTEDVNKAERTAWKLIQQDSFPIDEKRIGGIKVNRDEDGLICVVTRILYRKDTDDFKKPVLLPKNHILVDMLILQEHLANCHAGPQLLCGILREKVWILQARRTVKSSISRCPRCLRFKSKSYAVEPAPLPENRVNAAGVFEVTGVDLAGPMFLKNREKVWIVLFTCANYRCVHMEVVHSLSTEAFLDAFSSFCELRGRPAIVYSDNGTNFVGANHAFKDMNWEKIKSKTNMDKIKWIFNPPSAAWWGGWWERMVRTVKELLRRTLGKTTLTNDKFRVLVTEIAGVINRRPLTTMTDDPEDLSPLTPATFLNERPRPAFNDCLDASGFRQINKERKSLLDMLKERFRKEYLGMLVQRQKEKKTREYSVGDIVLIGSDNRKRWEWPMARILELLPGTDGNVRVAKLKTATGVFTRPLQRLFPMECSSPNSAPSVVPVPILEVEDAAEEDPIIFTRFGRKVKVPQRLGIN